MSSAPLFSKRHYEWLADVMRAQVINDNGTSRRASYNYGIRTSIEALADALARDNPKFNRGKFLAAAGMYHEAVNALVPS